MLWQDQSTGWILSTRFVNSSRYWWDTTNNSSHQVEHRRTQYCWTWGRSKKQFTKFVASHKGGCSGKTLATLQVYNWYIREGKEREGNKLRIFSKAFLSIVSISWNCFGLHKCKDEKQSNFLFFFTFLSSLLFFFWFFDVLPNQRSVRNWQR